jgi:16S rRNA (guanine527-N7)-methyltransferase
MSDDLSDAAPDGLTSALAQDQRTRLTAYRDRLAAANQTLNLTSLREPAELQRRHIEESLAVLRAIEGAGLLPPGARLIDVGSGGGLPGMPIAIARPDLAVTLLEATGKKAAFLERVAAELRLTNVRVVAQRAEEAARTEERERYDLAIARAVAALAALAELTLPLVRVGGAVAAVKGSRAEQELAEAGGAIARCGGGAVRSLPLAGALPELRLPELRLLLIAKVAPTPPELPRRAGMPVKRPLR